MIEWYANLFTMGSKLRAFLINHSAVYVNCHLLQSGGPQFIKEGWVWPRVLNFWKFLLYSFRPIIPFFRCFLQEWTVR
jgi:hypothetical protein